ncbi:MAG: HK97 family phage prohead protease [Bacteroidales bacterium]|jgi:hypothetical protein|nr:HK97 family phage prohead protease [Bacteroidales bacterium]
MPKEAVISTSSLNSYGTRVLTEGIDLEQYRKNPIMLWMHNRVWRGSTDEVQPIGTIDNLRIDGDKLIGTPVFDEDDEFALKLKKKWDKGILRMMSAGLEIVEESSDMQYLLPGQTRKTLTKTKLIEVSIVDIGANDDALALYKEDRTINLAATSQSLDFLNLENTNKINQNKTEQTNKNQMEKIALALGLAATATESDVLAKIMSLQRENGEAIELRKEQERQMTAAIEQEVNGAIACSKITADKREHFIQMGKTMGLAALQQTLAMLSVPGKPSETINQQTATPGGTPKTYSKLSEVPEGELVALRKENFAEYAKLYKAEYGKECEI